MADDSKKTAAKDDVLRAGVVGLGMIGGGVAVSLARRGRVPSVFDVRSGVSDELEGVPAQLSTAAEVARNSDVVLVAVVTADQAREVLTGENGVLAAAHEGLVVALLSTVSVASVKELAALCEDAGVSFLDAGVTGGDQAADNGLTVMVGGADDVFERARPVLEDFAKLVVHCGELGAGMITKLARNAITYATWAVVREGASIANAGGVPLDKLIEVLQGAEGGTSPLTMLQVQAAGVEIPEDRVESATALADKDLDAAQEFAASVGLEVPLVDIARPRMRAVYSGALPEALPSDPWERGLVMMDRFYGPGYSDVVPRGSGIRSVDITVEHLFAEILSHPSLTIRDRRLLTFGVTSALGLEEPLKGQVKGAIINREFTDAQLREIVVHVAHYAGWPNSTVVQAVFETAIAQRAAIESGEI